MGNTTQEIIKAKKVTRQQLVDSYFHNHPHRLALVDVGGTLSLVIDERSFTSPGLSATHYDFPIDCTLLDDFTRELNDAFPWSSSFVNPSQGAFFLAHQRSRFWDMVAEFGTAWSSVVVGTATITPYTRASTLDPWVAGTPTTEDINAIHQIDFNGGGDPDSGGWTADVLGEISYSLTFTVAASRQPPTISEIFFRDPKDDTWATETTVFSDFWVDHISTSNTSNGGGFSGSCSLSLTFS